MTEEEYQAVCREIATETLELSNKEAWKAMTETDRRLAPVLRELGIPDSPSFVRHDLRYDAWAERLRMKL